VLAADELGGNLLGGTGEECLGKVLGGAGRAWWLWEWLGWGWVGAGKPSFITA